MKRATSIGCLALSLLLASANVSAQRFNARISLIEAGEFHGDEVTAKSGERWLGLFPTKRGGFALRPATLRVTPVRDLVVDEDPRAKTGKKVSVRGGDPVFLLKGAAGLRRGNVATVFSGEKLLGNAAVVELKHGAQTYELKVLSDDPAPSDDLKQNSKLVLTGGGRSQVLFAAAAPDDAGWWLHWAGDIDGDGKLDLYLDLNTHYNTSQRRLFLSGGALRGEMVRQVAEFSTVGC